MKRMYDILGFLVTVISGVALGWILGTLGFMSGVVSLQREEERRRTNVQNHPSSRNIARSNNVGPLQRAVESNNGLQHISVAPITLSDFEYWHDDWYYYDFNDDTPSGH